MTEAQPVDETQGYDVVVVGGGLAAICAAVQAGRLGCRTVLLEKDPVLGGNAGPLLGVHVSGAHSFHPYASELGIIGEIIEEAAWQRAKIRTHGLHYNISQQFETVLKQTLDAAGVTVYRRTYGRDCETTGLDDGRRRITAVIAEDTARFRTVRFEVGTAVIDGSGDGHVACRAGADYRRGRESRAETGERSAVEVADGITLGTSLTALARRCREPVEFTPPPGTPEYQPGYGLGKKTVSDTVSGDAANKKRCLTPFLDCLRSHSSWNHDGEFCFLWHTETGGHLDTIDDDHAIYEALLRELYSVWAHIKTAHAEEAANWELTWVSPKAGKRESRRFVGDHVLTQTEVEAGQTFADAVCFGGYSVDIHNPAGPRGEQVEVVFYSVPPIWSMPYRCLYSRNVTNLYLAGRLASVTHLGLGSWRLMRTLSGGGQAVGVAVALAHRHGCDNRTVGTDHLTELRRIILSEDGGIPQAVNDDPADLARSATVTATSETRHGVEQPDDWLPLDVPRGVQAWSWRPELEAFQALLRNDADAPATVRLTVAQHTPDRPWKDASARQSFRYEPVANRMEWGADNRLELFTEVAHAEAELPPRFEGWVRFDCPADLAPPDECSDEPRVNFVLRAGPEVVWARSERRHDFARRLWLEPGAEGYESAGDSHCFRLDPAPLHGEAVNVIDGVARRWSTNPIHAWQADPTAALPQSLTVTWPEPVEVARVVVMFDTLTRAYREMPFDSEQRVSPMCVADYRIDLSGPGDWQTVVTERDNYHRRRVHDLPPCRAASLRLVIERVWDGSLPARVYEVRVYAPGR